MVKIYHLFNPKKYIQYFLFTTHFLNWENVAEFVSDVDVSLIWVKTPDGMDR